MKRGFLVLISIISWHAMVNGQSAFWNVFLKIQEKEIHFLLERQGPEGQFLLHNGQEKIRLDRFTEEGRIRVYPVSVFDAVLRLPSDLKDEFEGSFTKADVKAPNNLYPIRAVKIKQGSFEPVILSSDLKPVVWKIQMKKDRILADSGSLLLWKSGKNIWGTILTPTGDYRYLNGEISGNDLFLQTFDGGHTYYFDLHIQSDSTKMQGAFLFSNSGRYLVEGQLSADPQAGNGFRQLEKASDYFHFEALDVSGNRITEKDPAFSNKVLVVQILGTWCPNCLDETRFLVEKYTGKPSEVEFIGLAFERKDDPEYAFSRINVVKNRLNVPYPVYWGGLANKDSASKKLKEIAPIQAFPTTVFVDKKGKIFRVHSGFSGPATGQYYLDFKKEFEETIRELTKK